MGITMFLRFRDLVGPTIEEHEQIILQKGEVWWAWWSKPDEHLPVKTFSTIAELIIEESEVVVFLVDSGRRKLYKAELAEIKCESEPHLIPSPDSDKTPAYYNKIRYLAWFRFKSISEVSPETVREYSYMETEDGPHDPDSAEFDNKQIQSISEMLGRRHRTIWFGNEIGRGISPGLAGGPAVPVSSTIRDSRPVSITPGAEVPTAHSDAQETPIVSSYDGRSNYVLHLSDMHFSRDFHAFGLDRSSRTQRTLFAYLNEDISRLFGRKPPAAVIISGDITWRGLAEEFELAREFIDDLLSTYALVPEQLLVVPGNHDIRWSSAADGYDPTRPVDVVSERATQNYRTFYRAVFGRNESENLSMGRRYTLENGVTLSVLGLNSCLLEHAHHHGYGFVSTRQIGDAVRELGWNDSAKGETYRIAVLHHHLIPVSATETPSHQPNYSVTIDAGHIMEKLVEAKVDLVLHGHMHQPYVGARTRYVDSATGTIERRLRIVSSGSCGVKRDLLGRIGKHCYSVIEFNRHSIIVKVRATADAADEFNSHKDYNLTGEFND